MIVQRSLLYGVMALGISGAIAERAAAAPVTCAGGTLDITAVSDTPFSLPTFNVGQQTTLTAAMIGFTATSYAWTIPGPHIKDYNDDLGTKLSPVPASPLPWSTAALTTADLTVPTVTFYWKPSSTQIHPLTGGPEARVVTLTVTPTGGGSCISSATFMIERNLTNPDKQPEDFYTSTHRATTTTNPGFGRVVDEHIYWHQFVGGGPAGNWRQFLAWHGYLLRRFDDWRTEFGYDKVAPWYPGRPLPTGPAFNHPASLRLTYFPASNRIPSYFTIAGGSATDTGGQKKIADYSSLNAFSNSFESSYHGSVHCNIGPTGPGTGGFFDTSGPGFGSMCKATSPKDPMFWRWHGFIDTLYRNYCGVQGISCHSGSDAGSDPWMGDNDPDIAANGNVPSPGPRWLSPDIWNRRAAVATDGCNARDAAGDLNTVGGVVRDCGSSADHENPVTGVENYLYATLRNTRPGPARNVYAEVAVYIANASTGLSWPTDFNLLPESRQFITLNLEPGQVTDIGPLPWTPPSPTPSDHWCLYIRVLSVQETPFLEGPNVDSNVANSNSIAWRNVKVVEPGAMKKISTFIVRNIQADDENLELLFEVAPQLLKNGKINLRLDEKLQRGFTSGKAKLDGIEMVRQGVFVLTSEKSRITGIRLAARQQGVATLQLSSPTKKSIEGDIRVTQVSGKGVDGGVVMRIAKKGAHPVPGRDLKQGPGVEKGRPAAPPRPQ